MLTKEEKNNCIKKSCKTDKDTGSSEVQVTLLTKQIQKLNEHLKTHRKDKHSHRGLINLLSKRKKFLYHSKKTNIQNLLAKILFGSYNILICSCSNKSTISFCFYFNLFLSLFIIFV